MVDVTWNFIVHVPQLEALTAAITAIGDTIVA